MNLKETKNFTKGLITAFEDHSIPDGSSSNSNNWLTKGDHIELRKGYEILGTELSGTGKVTGIHVASKADGTQVLFRKRGRKLEYYDTATSDWVESGTNLFPVAATNEDVTFTNYSSLAGNQVFISSPNSGLYKIMTANPGSVIDLYQEDQNFKGYIKVKQNRMFLWKRNEDTTGVYGSYIDSANYTTVSNESIGTGDGADTTFSATLSKQGGTVSTIFAVEVSAISSTTANITAITNATQAQITATAHGFSVGDSIIISGITGSPYYTGTGTVSNSANDSTVTGVGTAFLTQLKNNSVIIIAGQSYKIRNIASDTSLTTYDQIVSAHSGVAFNYTSMDEISNQVTTVASVVDANNFTVNIDTSNYKVWTTGGTVGKAEVLTDDYNGVLSSPQGSTGTINYTTGAIAITFANAPANLVPIFASYQLDYSNNGGVTSFTKSSPRTAGQGFVFRQDDGGGDVMSVESYGDTEYCLHRLKTWALTITDTDTNATNLIYRDNVGIPNIRAAVSTGDGVYYADDYNESDPKFRLLTVNNLSTQVIPLPVSDQLKLENYRFDQAAVKEWGDYVLFACRHKDSDENDTVFTYNKRYKAWDKLDYYVSCFEIYNGALLAGDSVSQNVYELFSGFSDNNSTIRNSWEGNLTDHGIKTLKKTRRLWLQGEISRDQTLNFYLQTDRGSYVLVGTQNGTDDNVDTAPRTVIGSDAIGQSTLGGQTSTNVYNYTKEIRLSNGRYQYAKLKVEATEIGYASVSTITYFDIITNQQKLPSKYRSET